MGETKEEDSLIEFRLDSEVSFVFTYSYKLLFAEGSFCTLTNASNRVRGLCE